MIIYFLKYIEYINKLPTVQFCAKTMHVLTCPLHALVYEIECDYRARIQSIQSLTRVTPISQRPFTVYRPSLKSSQVKSTEVKQEVYLQSTSAVALTESSEKRKGHFRLSVDLEKAAELVNVLPTCLEGI